ncbi:MAG: alpha/beta fold hydrolase [Candidatus Marinimicrobia bacterium]|nr:alpha/beta fold hydrolase [Candidatus Neomarinimicrobiota bacterium]
MAGAALHYTSVGAGEPLIVIHGGPGLDHTYFLPHLEALANDYQLIFYDQRAVGLSTGAVDSASMSINQFIADLDAVRAHFKLDKVNLLGHSWGAHLATIYAIKYPERVGKLILAASTGATAASVVALTENRIARTHPEDAEAFGVLASSPGFAAGDQQTISQVAKLLFKPYFKNEALLAQLNLDLSSQTAKHLFPIFAAVTPYLSTYDITADLARITAPTLVIHGDYDPIPPRFAEELHQLIPDSRLVLLENSGHFSFVETPEPFFSAIRDFLK